MLNIVTFSANLCNQLSNKILEKFNQSKEDFFERISNKYRQDITYLETKGNTLVSSKIEKFADGTFKTTSNLWDLLDTDDKQEAESLINLDLQYKQDIRKLRVYLLPLANKTQQISDVGEVTSIQQVSYLKFLGCLPDFIRQDTELLTREINYIGSTKEEELYEINKYLSSLSIPVRVETEEEINKFIKQHKNEEVNNIISSLYALDFLVDF